LVLVTMKSAAKCDT